MRNSIWAPLIIGKFYKGVRKYYALEDVEKVSIYFYNKMSYDELKKERKKLYEELKEKESIYENKQL